AARAIALWTATHGETPLRVSARYPFCRSLGRQDINDVINRQFGMTAAAAQAVDQLMASDCRHPWSESFVLIPSLPLQMDGQQRLLYHIFDIAIPEPCTRKAAAHYLPQKRCQRL